MVAYKVRRVLKETVRQLAWAPEGLGYHAFRRSGACWAYEHGVDLDRVKVHGGWKSDAIWQYLIKTPTVAGQVARAFKVHL